MDSTTKTTVSVDDKIATLEATVNKELAEEVAPDASKEEVKADASEVATPEVGQVVKELMEKKGFKSSEDIARAYKALESRSTKAEQAKGQLEEQLKELQAIKKSEMTSEQQEALDVLEKTIDKVLNRRLQPIQDVIGVQKVDKMIQEVQGQHPDFQGAVVDEVLDYMVDHRGISMEDAFKILNYDKKSSAVVKKEVIKTKEADASRAFVESASESKVGKEIDYSKLSLDELEQLLPVEGQFIDHKGKLRQG